MSTITDEPITFDHALSREERRTTGRVVAVVTALMLIILTMYHAWIRKTAILAGVIIPALIMVLYTAWVLYSAKKDKHRKLLLENGVISTEKNLTDLFFSKPKSYTTLDNINETNVQSRGSTISSSTSKSKQSASSLLVKSALSHTGRVQHNRIVKPLHKRTDKRIRKKYLSKPHVTFNKEFQQFIRSYSVA